MSQGTRDTNKCSCGGDWASSYSSEDHHSPSNEGRRHVTLPPNRKNEVVCKECGKTKRRKCSPFLVIFSILNIVLIILGAGLAVGSFYTSSLGDRNVGDLRTFEYQYHLQHVMWSIGVGGILAAITGILGLVAINPKVGNAPLRVAYELMLLLTAAFLLVLGALAVSAILIRRNAVDSHFRPIMTAYQHEEKPEIFMTLHRFQAEFRCCGLSKPPDPYEHLHGTERGPLPWSCCASFTTKVLKDAELVEKIVEEARKRNCSHDVAGTHSTFCDQIYHELADWALGSGIEAMAVSLYCVILTITSCITRRVDSNSFEDSEYGR